ncbi:hypothetical protein, variant 2 [Blastomyces gilchristii SLH14081]|uniref:Uncharacterized protein n=1 Tax=Blastomyces gilchristii (strain SLH14081) TaxID=559298 RepID=A0A179U6C1_BLAGS|nr:uncharacterized protein BDBG_00092 [Blastomyces gilchristii SLH14081]XP_031575596.1 hypothetical protein, variant 1 [Blastomyces gilchristii SLH14081]XP_031575597.1 hypothetical protein, variant 2 [Blastomyces gilchristii SLH14081]OAT03360.1 hypothetical protein BDBG_00092 [Blastomyces gilchristii SLH14081]OAT03361.1 hypothetical protein, variant 1 [Blastomyces gilchristii SLH14081]OAT03362.1 hypothetical protein, variant 2 [Blastomyces gilchristii SLH14081]
MNVTQASCRGISPNLDYHGERLQKKCPEHMLPPRCPLFISCWSCSNMQSLISNVRDFGIWFIVYHPISILCRCDRRRRIHKRPVCQECSLQTPVSRRVNQPDFTLQVPEPRFSRLPAVDCLDLFASLLALIHTQHATLLGGESA